MSTYAKKYPQTAIRQILYSKAWQAYILVHFENYSRIYEIPFIKINKSNKQLLYVSKKFNNGKKEYKADSIIEKHLQDYFR